MANMKLSKYIVWVETAPNFTIAACTLTGSIIKLNPIAREDLKRGNPNELNDLTPEQFKQCVAMGFLVSPELNEQNYFAYLINKDRLSPEALTTYVAFST